jgi:hypothetical protein
VFNIFSHQGNANQNYTKSSSHSSQIAFIKKATTNVGEDAGKKEPSYSVGKNVN